MGVFDKMLDVMRLNDDEYDDYDEYEDEYEDEEVERKSFFSRARRTGTDDVDMDEPVTVSAPKVKSVPRSSGSSSKITPIRSRGKSSVASAMEVCVIKPASFEDSRDISETLLANRTVILNMEGLDMALAQRIIDFVSGSCFAENGNLEKIGSYIFVVTPESVDISGDLQGMIGTFDFSGEQTSL